MNNYNEDVATSIREEELKKYQNMLDIVDEFINTTDFEVFKHREKIQLTDDIYFYKNEYNSKPYAENRFQNHRKIIEVHYSYKGTEQINVCHTSNLNLIDGSNEGIDTKWYEATESSEVISKVITKGEYLILFPGDAHETEISIKCNENIKVIFRINL